MALSFSISRILGSGSSDGNNNRGENEKNTNNRPKGTNNNNIIFDEEEELLLLNNGSPRSSPSPSSPALSSPSSSLSITSSTPPTTSSTTTSTADESSPLKQSQAAHQQDLSHPHQHQPQPHWSLQLQTKLWNDRLSIATRRLGHPYQSRAPAKHKKPRTSFNKDQVAELEKRFVDQKYLASTERATLAKQLRMSDAQVKTWFQNRRTKWRRQAAEEKEEERQVACRLLQSSSYLAQHYAPQPSYFARPDVAI